MPGTDHAIPVSRFDIAGHCSLGSDPHGLPLLRVDNPLAEADLLLLGGNLLRCRSRSAGELIWCSGDAVFDGETFPHGGVPLCWPWFGGQQPAADAPRHGLLRQRDWELVATRAEDDGATSVVLAIDERAFAGDARARAWWPHAFRVELHVRIGADLRMELHVRNSGDRPFAWTGALHAYLPVGDVRRARVFGLEGHRLMDHGVADGPQLRTVERPACFPDDFDGVYAVADARCRLDDPVGARALRIDADGSRSLVLWNPGSADAATGLPGLRAADWASFLCIEPAVAGEERIAQAPGSVYVMRMRMGAA